MFKTVQKTIPEMFGVRTVTLIPFKTTSATSSKEIALQESSNMPIESRLHTQDQNGTVPPREGTDHFVGVNFQELYSEYFLCEQVCQCGGCQVQT